MVRDEDARVFHSALFQADRDVRVTIVVVHHVNRVCVGSVHAVNYYSQQGAALHVHITVKHHQGEEVVRRGAHIAVVYDADVFLLVVGEDVNVFFSVIYGMLAVVSGELDGSCQAVFREPAVAVEVIETGIRIPPSADYVSVGVGVFEDLTQRLAAEAVLGFLVGHVKPFFRVAEGI